MSSEEDLFEKYVILEMARQLKEIVEYGENILRKNIQEFVYDNYNPVQYNRSYDLINSIKHVFSVDDGIIYFNASSIGHTNDSNTNVGMYTPKWLDEGHSDFTGIDNYYHSHPATNFIDKTITMLEQKYGEGCVTKIDI